MFIVEGVAGVWFYHLSDTGKSGHPALCGEQDVMSTSLPITSWGYRGHLKERYCTTCQTLREKRIASSEGSNECPTSIK